MAFDYEMRLRLRRGFGVAAPVALLGLAGWCYLGFPTPDTPAQAARPPAVVTPVTPADADLPDGPGTTEPGIYVSVTPTAVGALEMYEVVWLRKPVDEVTLRPPVIEGAGPMFAASEASASMVQLTAGGQPVRLASPDVTTSQQVALTRPTQQFELRYQLTGVAVRSLPSTSGRASAALAPLSDITSDLPVVVWTSGGSARNIQCPQLPSEARSCAGGEPSALRTMPGLRSSTALVVIQLDLPRP